MCDPIGLAVKSRHLCLNGVCWRKKLPHSLIKKKKKKEPVWRSFMSELCIVKAKCGGWGIQTAGTPPRRQLSWRASQRRLLTETETSYDTSTTRVGGGWRSPLSAEAATLSTEPNLFQTQRQPKGDQNQNQRAIFFFCRGRILSSTPCFPHAAAAAEQGREQKTAFNTEPWGATPAIRE